MSDHDYLVGSSNGNATGMELEMSTQEVVVASGSGLPSRKRPRTQGTAGGRKEGPDGKKPKRQSPKEVRVAVCKMIKAMASAYNAMCLELRLNDDDERELIQNSLSIEKMILSAHDDRKTEFLKGKEGGNGKDPDFTGGKIYRKTGAGWTMEVVTIPKERVKQYWATAHGTEDNYGSLAHLMIWHSNLNDTCFKRSKALRAAGLEESLISTFSGSTLPRRAGNAGNAVKGIGTHAAEAIRMINRAGTDRYLLSFNSKGRAAYEGMLKRMQGKLPTAPQKAMVEQIMRSRAPGHADADDLRFLVKSSVVLRGSISHKMSFPLTLYYQANRPGGVLDGKTEYSLVGKDANMILQKGRILSIIRDGESDEDKSQLAWLALRSAAFEDLRVSSALAGRKFKPRGQLNAKGFTLPTAEHATALRIMPLSIGCKYWAPMTKSGGNTEMGKGTKGQVGCQPAFAVERKVAVSAEGIRYLLGANISGARDMDHRAAIIKMIETSMKSDKKSFKGKKVFPMTDDGTGEGVEMPSVSGVDSFFFADRAEEFDE